MKLAQRLVRGLLLAGLVITASGPPVAAARTTILSDAALAIHGPIVELHFKVQGPPPAWHLEGRRQQLVLTLERTELGLPPAPLAGQMHAPLTGLHAAAVPDGTAQLLLDVKGRVAYAVAFTRHDLIVRVARAGDAPNIAAPLVIPAERIRRVLRRIPAAPAAGTATDTPQARAPAADSALTTESIAAAPVSETATDTHPAPASAMDLALVTPPTAASPPAARASRTPVVVIDPGHGGRDPGTQSESGIVEKDLALAIAIRLQRALSALGITAHLTRTDDHFLSLAERTQFANRDGADLFVSIHLNSSPDRTTTGIETYYLDNTTDRATIRLARMENDVAGGYQSGPNSNLNYILTDLRQGDKAHEAVALSNAIEAESVATLSVRLGVNVNNLGARQGPFYVLVGAAMPAVLVECGFLSNAGEAQRLADARYQQGLAEGIAGAVAHYFTGDAAVGNL